MHSVQTTGGGRPKRSSLVGRYWRLVAALAVLASLVGFAGSAAARSDAKPELREGAPYSFLQFWKDPANYGANGTQGAFEASLNYAALFHMTPTGQIQPGLATKWRYFDGGHGPNKDFELTLRHDAKFSDGTPVNAAAVVTWFKHMYSVYGTPSAGFSALLGLNPQFKAVGSWTVRIRLTTPTPGIPALMSDTGFVWGWVGSPACAANPTLFAKQNCGAGPYMIDWSQTVSGDHYTYVPNPYYYDKKNVKFSKVTIKVIPVVSSLLQAVQSGQLDMATPGNDASTVAAAKTSGLRVTAAKTGTWVLFFKPKVTPALNDARVRQAINYALDRKAIAAATGFGFSLPYSQWPVSDAPDKATTNYYKYDVAKAKSLMAAAGVGNVNIVVHVTPAQLAFLPVLQKYLDPIGVHLDGQTYNPANASTYFFGDGISLSQISFSPTPAHYLRWFSPASTAATMPGTPEMAKLFYAGLKAKDPTADWSKLWSIQTKQALQTTIETYNQIYYSTKAIGGLNVNTARLGSPLIQELTYKG